MAITVQNDLTNGIAYFDSADASGTETILAATTGVTWGIKDLDYSCDTAGESTFAHGYNMIFQLPANGGLVRSYAGIRWGTAGTALTITSPAGGASGSIAYVSK